MTWQSRSLSVFKSTLFDDDHMDLSPCDRCALHDVMASNACSTTTSLAQERLVGNIVPHRGNRWNM